MEPQKLKSLETHNQMVRDGYPEYPKPNGIACPKCGFQLRDKDPTLLLSHPPQVTITCFGCGYHGTRLA